MKVPKRFWIYILIALAVILLLVFLSYQNNKTSPITSPITDSPSPTATPLATPEPSKVPVSASPTPASTATDKFSLVAVDQKMVETVIKPYMLVGNYGDIYESYGVTKDTILFENQFGGFVYSDDFPSNVLVLVTVKDGKVDKTDLLASGNYLVHLYKENGSPFIKASGDTLVMFYEVSQTTHYPQSGKVYKLNKGQLTLVYEAKYVFDHFERDKSGNLVLVEKEYDDNKNRYPTELKPYYLHYLTYKNGQFTETNKTHTDPNNKKLTRSTFYLFV